ncbi:MAG: tetratricopeptide repeat protein [Chlamydiae bacterium]|nr:tetratricopeptide repeat protein [Chlamydiota bacterium]
MHPTRLNILLGLLIALLTTAIYIQVSHHPFLPFDDNGYVTKNAHVQKGLTLENIRWAFKTREMANWHPLTWISHIIDAQMYGLNPSGHHLTNLFFHIFNSLLLFTTLFLMTGIQSASFFTAFLFALHPLHVESVAWVAERKDVLSAFFGIGTLLFYSIYTRSPSLRKYLGTIVIFILGLLSKPTLVSWPFVLLLLDDFPLNRFSKYRWKCLWEKIPFFILSVGSCWMTFLVQRSGGAVRSLEKFSLMARIKNTLVSYMIYIKKMFWPVDLAYFYPHPGNSLPLWEALGAFIVLVIISYGAIQKRRNYPYLLTGWFWFLITLIPVIGLVQVGMQGYADRYTYLPLIGLFMILSWGARDLLSKLSGKFIRKIVVSILYVLILGVMPLVTWGQIKYWESSRSLFERAVHINPQSDLLYFNWGVALSEEGQLKEAIEVYQKTLQLNPGFAKAYNNLGFASYRQGRMSEAIQMYEKALKIKPDFMEAHDNFAAALADLHRFDEALMHYTRALELSPDSASLHNNLGALLIQMNRLESAVSQLQEALRIKPDYLEAHFNLALAFMNLEDLKEASLQYLEVLRLKPDSFQAHYNLGLILVRLNLSRDAKKEFLEALRIKPDDVEVKEAIANIR